ncbi:MAG TPA: helix-turn-helix domain-containing protein [Syntrophomonas sp.]|nr:helix-turn-helix domain-containing protein [Syntrophomonas sp.]
MKICNTLKCDIADIMEIIPDEQKGKFKGRGVLC